MRGLQAAVFHRPSLLFLLRPVRHQTTREGLTLSYFYDRDNARPVLAVRLSPHQMARIDKARHRVKLSRSDLTRRALNDLLDRMQVEAAAT